VALHGTRIAGKTFFSRPNSQRLFKSGIGAEGKFKAQLALGRYGYLELRSNGGIEAGAGCRGVLESGEMEPSQVVVEVFGCHAAPGAQEGQGRKTPLFARHCADP